MKISQELQRYTHLFSETNAAYHRLSQQLGISDSVTHVLYTAVIHGGHCLLSDIIKLSGVSKQTINSALRKMEEQGLLCMEAAQGRQKGISLTEKGVELAQNTVCRIIAIEDRIFSSWSKEEMEQYLKLNQRFLDEFKQYSQEEVDEHSVIRPL